MDLSGRHILVTGATGGLGAGVVPELLARGGQVTAVYRDPRRRDKAAASWGAPPGLTWLEADLTQEEAVQGVFRAARPLDAVVHLAGGYARCPVAEMSLSEWEHMLRLNLTTTFLVLREAARHLARGGSLVAVGAAAARSGAAEVAHYTAAKAGLLRLVESLAEELRPSGIRVNAVLPGLIDTPANREAMAGADRSRWVAPRAIGQVIAFLCSPVSSAVNGAAILVTG